MGLHIDATWRIRWIDLCGGGGAVRRCRYCSNLCICCPSDRLLGRHAECGLIFGQHFPLFEQSGISVFGSCQLNVCVSKKLSNTMLLEIKRILSQRYPHIICLNLRSVKLKLEFFLNSHEFTVIYTQVQSQSIKYNNDIQHKLRLKYRSDGMQ